MPDEVTNAELARRLAELRDHLHDDLTEIKARLAQLVPREVYDAHRAAQDQRQAALEQRVTAVEDARKSANRWMVTAVVVPLLMLVVQVVLNHWLRP